MLAYNTAAMYAEACITLQLGLIALIVMQLKHYDTETYCQAVMRREFDTVVALY